MANSGVMTFLVNHASPLQKDLGIGPTSSPSALLFESGPKPGKKSMPKTVNAGRGAKVNVSVHFLVRVWVGAGVFRSAAIGMLACGGGDRSRPARVALRKCRRTTRLPAQDTKASRRGGGVARYLTYGRPR